MKRARKGFVLLDAVVATGLLAVLLTVSVRWVTSMSAARRAIDDRAIALQLAANAMERASTLAWPQLTKDRLDELANQALVGEVLSGAALSLTVEPAVGELAAKHIRAEITWNNPGTAPKAPVRLDYWAFEPAEVAP
jgi:type II secretory pathway component PulJ